MARRVLLTGASGFVGSNVLKELVRRGFAVNALINRAGIAPVGGYVKEVRADLFDAGSLDAAMADCDAVVHLVGIIREIPSKGITFECLHFEATRKVVEAAKRCGIKRYIQMSALGVRADAASDYAKTKWKGEEAVRGSGLEWTIFRPSLIHGPGGEFMRMEAGWVKKAKPPFLFMPYFGSGVFGLGGGGRIQPIFVGDVARAFVDALSNEKSVGKTYDLGGADQLAWPQMHQIAAEAIAGRRRFVVAIPVWYAKLLAAIVPGGLLPFNRDQVVMSQEENTGDMGQFEADFGWKPGGFHDELVKYAAVFA